MTRSSLLQTIAMTIGLIPCTLFGQFTADLSTTENTNCNGTHCDYDGPSILINELMMSPNSFDGSLFGGLATQAGEWIELYNPDICDSIDISCYYLGNNTNDGGVYPGGYVIPPGTVVPPSGFAMIRGVNAAPVPVELLVENGGNVVELVVDGDGVCIGGGTRLWFPNAGGWFAFYDNNGVPQDAVSWANQSNIDQNPCVPALPGCSYGGTLPNYEDFPNDRKEYILDVSAADHQGESLRRIPDGGDWSGPGNPTYAICNDACIDAEFLICNGTATAEPQGGVAPYNYLWDDFQMQTTQTATRLCAGEYCVLITDALGDTLSQCIIVEDASYETNISDGFCEGETYTLPDNSVVDTAGVYTFTLQSAGGCDSMIVVELETYPDFEFTDDVEICDNQTYTLPDGSDVATSGTYNFEYQTVHGCDSNYTINLTVLPPVEITQSAEICPGTTFELPDGTEVEDPGVYNVMISGGTNCDTLYIIDVGLYAEIEIDFNTVSDISCFGENDGSVSLDLIGGTTPYDILWSDGQEHGADASGLAPGSYSVEIIDANGCETETSFDINEPQPVELTASADTLICLGSESNLVAQASGGTGNFTFHWNHTASTASVSTVSPEENTAYTVFASDENGCETDSIQLLVSVISMDSTLLEITPGDPVCAGGETTVSAFYDGAHPPYTYNWSHGLPDGPGPHTVSPDETTVYTVSVSDDCGNEVSSIVPATVWPLPVADISSLADISCFGMSDGTAQLDVSGGTPEYTFDWSDGHDHGAVASGLAPGSYSIEITDANGCETETSFDINEPQPVELTASSDTLVCLGSESNLIASATGGTGNFTYHWSHNASTASVSTVSPEENTAYTVFASDENGCETDSIELLVSVISMDSTLLEITPGDPVCAGGQTTVSAFYDGAHPPYTYNWSHGLPDGPGPHTVSPDETTNYSVTVFDDCGNEVSSIVPATVWPLPVATAMDISDISCFGQNNGSAAIEVNGGTPDYNFSWNNSESNTESANDLSPGQHSVIIFDSNQCSDTLQFTIGEPEPFTLNAWADTLVCTGTEAELIAEATGGTGDITYQWNNGLNENANQTTVVDSDTEFTVFASDANGCETESLTLFVEVIDMDASLLTTSGGIACAGESTTIEAAYNGQHPPYTFNWSHNVPDGPGPHTVAPNQTTTYSVSVSDECNNEVTAEVTVIAQPLPSIDLPDLLAEGCAPLAVQFADTINDPTAHTYTWTVNENMVFTGNEFSYIFEQLGMHTVELTVTSHQGCTSHSDGTSLILVLESPVANFSANPWETGIDEPEVQFNDLSEGNLISWNWDFGDGSASNQQSPLYTFSDTGSYSVQLLVENANGCTDSISHAVSINPTHNITIPNAFTPPSGGGNGTYDPNDTSNDVFYPFADYVEDFQMSIFNRWGELIFESTEIGIGWDGTYRGEPCPQDVYVYKIEFVFSDGLDETRVGDITLFR